MEHENIDENTRYLTACENVKKIVNAIKLIKIKYYPNFAKISEEDKQVYNELEVNLEKISEDNNLNRLKEALMEEISAKYDKKDIKSEPRDPNFLDKELLACYGAIDAQQKALSQGKIKKARECQKILKAYLDELQSTYCKELVVKYKRDKLGELTRNETILQKCNNSWMNCMKGLCKPEYAEERSQAAKQIEAARMNSRRLINDKKLIDNNMEELQIG